MVDSNILLTLRGQHFLSQFRSQYIDKLAQLATEVQFEKNELIFREGDESKFFYLIVAGTVSVELTMPGRTLCVQKLGRGEELGWSALLPARSRRFQARALESARAVAFDGSRLLRECEQDYEFGYKLLRRLLDVVAERLEATQIQAVDIYSAATAKAS
jgi:CRP-like cAMP-binding protein